MIDSKLRGTAELPALVLDGSAVTLEQIQTVAERRCRVVLSDDPVFRQHIDAGSQFVEQVLAEDGVVYGVTTGFGDSCTRAVSASELSSLPRQLYTFHGCGLGAQLDPETVRAVIVVRLVSLCRGYSGVSTELLERLVWLLDNDVLPLIPEEGSVGASGDLTPLSYVAAVLCGERDVHYRGEQRLAADVLAELGIEPYQLKPKESLAIMNGTAVMTAIAALAFGRCSYLSQLCTRITAMASYALDGNPYHFDELLFAAKPHAGQNRVAEWLRTDLHAPQAPRNSARLQDRYSIRCAPHVIGVVEDSLPWWRQFLENELNSANDNPLVDPVNRKIMHGGHFYGGHVAFVMDSLKQAVANLADLLDRQMALLVDSRFNHGLPSNLSGADIERLAINHGYKAVQIGVSAWTAEALKLTMPASVFSRSTECHNQDKVSMGTIAARDAIRILTLVEQVAAAVLHAASQGVTLRERNAVTYPLPDRLNDFQQACREIFEPVTDDRALESELRQLCSCIRQRQWSLYES